MRPALAICAAALMAVAVAACGEKDEPEPVEPTPTRAAPGGYGGGAQQRGGGEQQDGDGAKRKAPPIRLTVEIVLNGSSQGACREAMTDRYIKTAYGDVQGCEAARRRLPVFDVAVSDVEITGATATAKARPDGGPNKGETIRVELVREGGTWKVDSAVSNAPAGP